VIDTGTARLERELDLLLAGGADGAGRCAAG
jgi:hypothetical protein